MLYYPTYAFHCLLRRTGPIHPRGDTLHPRIQAYHAQARKLDGRDRRRQHAQ